MIRLNKKFLLITVFIILFSITFSIISFADEVDRLKIHFLDVGQADSIFIELPDEKTMLIDGGNNEDGPGIVHYIKGLRKNKIKKIDYLIGTHPHEDHIGGLDNVIRSFEVGEIYLPKVYHTSKTFEDLMIAIKNKGLKISTAKEGKVIFRNNDLDLKAFILSPKRDSYDQLNNYSVVIKLIFANTSYLFTGDAEKIVEEELIADNIDLKADILKVGHHGSRSSTTEKFLERVSPDYAVISVGKDNRYGHPSSVIINRLEKRNLKIYRTDKQGTIIAYSDGGKICFNKKGLAVNKKKEIKDTGVYIFMVDKEGSVEEVIIKNNSDKIVDLSNWKLISEKGGQEYIFPPGTKILAHGEIKIVSGRAAKADKAGVLLWNNSYIWNNNGDPASLYNSARQLVSQYPES